MPALAAYVIALCLLLGGGYGALNWLATAPTAKHVMPRVKPKSNPPSYELHSETPHAISSPNAFDVSAAKPMISETDDYRPPASSISRPGATEANATLSGDRRVDNGGPPTTHRINGKVVANEVAPKSKPTFSSRGKAVKPSHPQQATRSDKRQLVLMTLRTIQFPDGRQTTQLIPYRSRARILAAGIDDNISASNRQTGH
jgi:hypothetical protein